MNKLTYKIHKRLNILSDKDNGYMKQLNWVSWGSSKPQIDIRSWKIGEDGCQTPLKGISLAPDEAIELRDALNQLNLDALV